MRLIEEKRAKVGFGTDFLFFYFPIFHVQVYFHHTSSSNTVNTLFYTHLYIFPSISPSSSDLVPKFTKFSQMEENFVYTMCISIYIQLYGYLRSDYQSQSVKSKL